MGKGLAVAYLRRTQLASRSLGRKGVGRKRVKEKPTWVKMWVFTMFLLQTFG